MCQQYPNAYLQNSVPVRVFYLARCKVCGYPCNGFLFIYFHICKFRAILIENEAYICPIKLKQPHDERFTGLHSRN